MVVSCNLYPCSPNISYSLTLNVTEVIEIKNIYYLLKYTFMFQISLSGNVVKQIATLCMIVSWLIRQSAPEPPLSVPWVSTQAFLLQ